MANWRTAIAAICTGALGACGGIVIDGPPGAPPFTDDGGADAPYLLPGVDAGRDPCVRVAHPVWCQAGGAYGYRCQAQASPRNEPTCVNIAGDPRRDPRWCC